MLLNIILTFFFCGTQKEMFSKMFKLLFFSYNESE